MTPIALDDKKIQKLLNAKKDKKNALVRFKNFSRSQ